MTERELRRECLEQAYCSECPFFDECDLDNKDYDDYDREIDLANNVMFDEIYG